MILKGLPCLSEILMVLFLRHVAWRTWKSFFMLRKLNMTVNGAVLIGHLSGWGDERWSCWRLLLMWPCGTGIRSGQGQFVTALIFFIEELVLVLGTGTYFSIVVHSAVCCDKMHYIYSIQCIFNMYSIHSSLDDISVTINFGKLLKACNGLSLSVETLKKKLHFICASLYSLNFFMYSQAQNFRLDCMNMCMYVLYVCLFIYLCKWNGMRMGCGWNWFRCLK